MNLNPSDYSGPAFANGNPEQGGDPGMTKREYISAVLMAAYIVAHPEQSHTQAARGGVIAADSLIQELERINPPTT